MRSIMDPLHIDARSVRSCRLFPVFCIYSKRVLRMASLQQSASGCTGTHEASRLYKPAALFSVQPAAQLPVP